MRPNACLLLACTAVGPAHADPDLRAEGAALFAAHCAACHGADATGGATGDIRGLSRATVLRALRGVEQMPGFDYLTEAEVAALLTWLGSAE